MTVTNDDAIDVASLSFEQARDELVRVVAELEQGAPTLEQSLALWERGEALAARCEEWLLGAKRRLDAARADGEAEALMAAGQRVVAELGRPETPDETAARKAASSAAYRGSQTFRNLIVALLVTLAVVLVVVFGVPRGELPTADSIDPRPIAAQAAQTYDREIIVPAIPDAWLVDDDDAPVADAWRVNVAEVSGDGGAQSWTIAYVPDATSFLRVAQGFDADEAWARSVLAGQSPDDEIDIDGVAWTVYEIDDPESAGNVSYALGTQAGDDHVLVYGSSDPDTAARLAGLLTDQVRILQEASR